MPDRPKTFRSRYDALEQRRAELLARLETRRTGARHPGARARAHAAQQHVPQGQAGAARRDPEAADWLIAIIDRTTMML